jgi:hypothetical protein
VSEEAQILDKAIESLFYMNFDKEDGLIVDQLVLEKTDQQGSELLTTPTARTSQSL